MIKKLYDKCVNWAGHRFAKPILAFESFIESSFFPIPPDVMIIPMVISKKNEFLRIALIATIFSVLGALFGYYIGYSLNDTVVVFDRVREYMINYKKKEVHEFINQSLNSTLSRTINTSLTTFFVLLIIFLFGGEVIKGFMFALMVGVIVGTYSSLFVASPIMVDTIKRKEIKNK